MILALCIILGWEGFGALAYLRIRRNWRRNFGHDAWDRYTNKQIDAVACAVFGPIALLMP